MTASPLDTMFSREDLDTIQAAVREVEARSPGEVVPYGVDRSDAYGEAAWATATLGALLGSVMVAVLHAGLGAGPDEPIGWLALLPALGAALGYVLGAVWPRLRLRLAHTDAIEHRVRQRAMAAFLEEEVFATRDRTGILLFLSLLERRVVILADAGISARVAQAEWDAIAAGIVAGMRQGRPGPALAAAIRRCGDVLAAHRFERRPDDRDELSDDLRRRTE